MEALQTWWASRHCEHTVSGLRRRVVKGGAIQYVRQCQRCGNATGQALSRTKATEENDGTEPQAFDEGLSTSFEKETEEGTKKITGDYDSRADFQRAEFFKWYDKYLSGEAWSEKRKKVFSRSKNLCEGCLQGSATEVHHITYDHIGDELLFELVAVCDECHKRLHLPPDRIWERT